MFFKKIAIIIVGLLFASKVYAEPYLVCDAYPEEVQVIKFVGIIDGESFETQYSLHPSGPAIIYDLGSLDDGEHVFSEIRAENARGQSDSVPFHLIAIPNVPLGLSIGK